MAFVDRIRLFGWVNEKQEETTLLGFPPGAVATGESAEEELTRYLAETDRTVRRIEAPAHLAYVAALCYEIVPPLEEKQLKRVAGIAVRHQINGSKRTYVIDNRIDLPERASQIGEDNVILEA